MPEEAAISVGVHLTRAVIQRARRKASIAKARRARLHALGWTLLVAAVIGTLFAFRPEALGGSVAYISVRGGSMTPTLHDGDLAIVRKSLTYHRADVVAFRVPDGQPDAGLEVIHRIIGGSGSAGFITKGDHNSAVDPWHPRIGQVLGKVWFSVPKLAQWLPKLQWAALAVIVFGLTSLAFRAERRRRSRAVKRVQRASAFQPAIPADSGAPSAVAESNFRP